MFLLVTNQYYVEGLGYKTTGRAHGKTMPPHPLQKGRKETKTFIEKV